jgi:hypothetical protein
MEHRVIVVDPYDRSVYELQSEADCREIQRLISNDEGDRPCDLFCTVNFGGGTTGYLDDNGNWMQYAWFALVDSPTLYCGRMVMVGSTVDGESASLDAGITTTSVMDKVIWLDAAGALEQAQKYTDAMAESASKSDLPVIHLDDGLVGRIKEAIENKERKAFARVMDRTYVNNPESDDYPHVGDVLVMETGRLTAPLPKCLDKVNHSPDGFAWGYGGSGPAQLAYAILFNVTNDEDKTQQFYQDYKFQVIAGLPREPWTITAPSVLNWLDEAKAKRASHP